MPININGNGVITGVDDLDVIGDTATVTPLVVQGASGQSANLFEVKNSSGTNLLQVDSAGLLGGSGTSMGAWTAYTPALTASTTNPTLGTGSTTTGAYIQIGKFVVANFRISFGSSGAAAGSGNYQVSLPVAGNTAHASKISGVLYFGDDSANVIRLGAPLFWVSSTTVSLRIDSTSAGGYTVTNAVPWTWANLDGIHGMFFYEAA